MPAANTDLLKKYKSLFSTTLTTGIGTGTGDTITPSTVTGLPTDTAITLTLDRVNSGGSSLGSQVERITGVISGGNLTSYIRGQDDTTEQAHSGGAVIEMVWNAQDWNDMVDWGLVEHNQDGTHKSTLVTSLGATASDMTAGTSTTKIATPKAIKDAADSLITLTDVTTNDVSTSRHGFAPKAPNDTTKFLRGDGTWAQPGSYAAPTTLTDGATITIDHSLNTKFYVTLGGNRTFAVSNLVTGKPIMLDIIQDSTGSRTVTWFPTTTDTVTMTIATPGVITTTKDIPTTTPVIFTTTGALPTGITAGTRYYWVRTGATTGNVATSIANAQAGTVIATSGSQSGTHTMSVQIRWGSDDTQPTLSTGKYRKDTFGFMPVDATNGVVNGYIVGQGN